MSYKIIQLNYIEKTSVNCWVPRFVEGLLAYMVGTHQGNATFEVIPIVYPDVKRNTSGQKLPDEYLEDNGTPRRL